MYPLPTFFQQQHFVKLQCNITTRVLTLIKSIDFIHISTILLILICGCIKLYIVLSHMQVCVSTTTFKTPSSSITQDSLMLPFINRTPLLSTALYHILLFLKERIRYLFLQLAFLEERKIAYHVNINKCVDNTFVS